MILLSTHFDPSWMASSGLFRKALTWLLSSVFHTYALSTICTLHTLANCNLSPKSKSHRCFPTLSQKIRQRSVMPTCAIHFRRSGQNPGCQPLSRLPVWHNPIRTETMVLVRNIVVSSENWSANFRNYFIKNFVSTCSWFLIFVNIFRNIYF